MYKTHTFFKTIAVDSDGAPLNVAQFTDVVIQLSGTWVGVVYFECAVLDDTAWIAILGTPIIGGAAVTSASANGAWRFNVAGLYAIRPRMDWTSGTSATAKGAAIGPQ